MRRKLSGAALIMLCVIAAIGATSPSQQRTWEYKFEYGISEKKANELGVQGWELVAIGAPGSGPASNVTEYVFKRAR